MKSKTRLIHRLVTLYVNEIDFNPKFEDHRIEQIAAIDMEFSKESIESIIAELQKRKNDPGSIRMRFTGRLVH